MDQAQRLGRTALQRILRRAAQLLAMVCACVTPAVAGSDLAGLSAARVAVEVAAGEPAVVVLWSPGCLACRKSLNEIERFAAKAILGGLAVRTIVPDDAQDAARTLLTQRGLTLRVEPGGEKLDAQSRRLLLDRPLAYAVDGEGRIVGSRGGLLGAWMLEELAGKVAGRAADATGGR